MTRDEAIKLYDENTNIHDQGDTPRMIDRFVKLGMLKLDEPKSAAERLAIELDLAGVSTGGINNFFDCVARANAKIVEK